MVAGPHTCPLGPLDLEAQHLSAAVRQWVNSQDLYWPLIDSELCGLAVVRLHTLCRCMPGVLILLNSSRHRTRRGALEPPSGTGELYEPP